MISTTVKGNIFKKDSSSANSYNSFTFNYIENNKKAIIITGECNLTYKEFISIYLIALQKNIEMYIDKIK